MMAKTKIYFWLKVDKKFFDNLFIKRLKNMPGGYTMTVIYIRLMLESLEDDCILYYEGYFDSLVQELALKLDVSEDDINMTVAYFTKCGLIQIDDDGHATLSQAKAMVESETNWAKYKREQRKNSQDLPKLENVQNKKTISNSCPIEIEIENRDIKENRDIEEIDPAKDNYHAAIAGYYQSRIGVLDGKQFEQLIDYIKFDHMEYELVKLAIDKAADNSKRNFGYVNSILKNWAQNGIKTTVQQEEEQSNFNKSKGFTNSRGNQSEQEAKTEWGF